MDARYFSFYIILPNYVRSISFYKDKRYNVRQIRFRVCIKMRRCKMRVCKGRTLFAASTNFVTGTNLLFLVTFFEKRR